MSQPKFQLILYDATEVFYIGFFESPIHLYFRSSLETS